MKGYLFLLLFLCSTCLAPGLYSQRKAEKAFCECMDDAVRRLKNDPEALIEQLHNTIDSLSGGADDRREAYLEWFNSVRESGTPMGLVQIEANAGEYEGPEQFITCVADVKTRYGKRAKAGGLMEAIYTMFEDFEKAGAMPVASVERALQLALRPKKYREAVAERLVILVSASISSRVSVPLPPPDR